MGSNMRIAIDISQIVYGTGVSHYRKHLAYDLLQIDRDNEYILFGGSLRRLKELKQFASTIPGNHADKLFYIPPTLADIIWNRLHVFPIEKLIGNIDILHTSDWAEPPSKAFKITTIHDLIPIKFPRMTPAIIRSTHENRLRWVAKESKRIIVPSNCTKNDLVELGFSQDIIRVIPEAPNLQRASSSGIEEVKRKYKIFDDYIISIGTKPWKNVERMIKAYHLSKYGKNLKYIIVGETKGTRFVDERGVRFLGFVSDTDLQALVSGAKALIFASVYEGLGIPILDAFNCECPVVTSNISSMPEVAGDAAMLIDPYNVHSIADGIEKILKGPKAYIERGLKRVEDFSWEKTARMTLDVYKEAEI
jgi:glycosyltransferase involved in cell wall biosynthesis